MAGRIGLKRAWFQTSRSGLPHYDLVPPRRQAAVEAGAIELARPEAVAKMREIRGWSTASAPR